MDEIVFNWFTEKMLFLARQEQTHLNTKILHNLTYTNPLRKKWVNVRDLHNFEEIARFLCLFMVVVFFTWCARCKVG